MKNNGPDADKIAEALNLLEEAGVDVDLADADGDQFYKSNVDLIEARYLDHPLSHYVYYHYEWKARDE